MPDLRQFVKARQRPTSDFIIVIQVQIRCSDGFPREAPEVVFVTPIFHPNVYANGTLCWYSGDNSGERYYMDAVVGAVNLLLRNPNPDSPANREAAELYKHNKYEYNRRARELTEQHALPLDHPY